VEIVRQLSAAVLAIVLSNPTSLAKAASPSDRTYMVLSNGQVECGEFLSDNPLSQKADVEWVLGYISGRNREASQGSRMAGVSFKRPEAVLVWLQDYCRTHSLDLLVDAADGLRAEFLRREGSQ
jgi:hypothetical protein